jgi:hypothetical protein
MAVNVVSPTRRRFATVLVVIGIAVVIPSVIAASATAKNALKIRVSAAIPSQFQVTLPSGKWEVYELTGTVRGGSAGILSFSRSSIHPLDIDASDVRVQDSDGSILPVTASYSNTHFSTYTAGTRLYTGVASFDASQPGRYDITVASPANDTVIVARPPFAGLSKALPAIGTSVLGGVAFLVGLILLILDFDRRRKSASPGRSSYPDPGYGSPTYGPPGSPPAHTWPKKPPGHDRGGLEGPASGLWDNLAR